MPIFVNHNWQLYVLMRIHKEGYQIIATVFIVAAVLTTTAYYFWTPIIWIPIAVIAFINFAFCLRFFRVPNRKFPTADNLTIYSPADGTIVAIEEVYENEYLGEYRIQVSVFMSIWNVHINWFPVGGVIEYFRHHHGRFLVAWHPKSSTDNERTTTVVDTGIHRVMFRQIAGYVARRIVSYAEEREGEYAAQNSQCGFIKFGSRVDIFLPLGSKINVSLGDKVVGTQTPLAYLDHKATR